MHVSYRVGPRACAALCLLASLTANAGWRELGPVEHVERIENAVEFSTASGALIRVSFLSQNVVRVRMTPQGPFVSDQSYAIQAPAEPRPKVQMQEDGNTDRINLRVPGGAHVVMTRRPNASIAIFDAQDNPVVEDDPVRPMSFDPATGTVEVSKRRNVAELYYGFGEKALPLSRHQQYMTMWNSDTPGYPPGLDPLYQSIPFFIALRDGRSYGVFLDNTWRSYFDMGKTDPGRYTFGAAGGELNYYVFTGGHERSPANVVRDYSDLTGRGGLPPIWALGYQQSRYSYTPQARVSEVARTFRDKKIPADVIYLDIGYMDGYRIFSWSPQDFPQPEKLLGELRDEGFHAVTIVDPGIKLDRNYPIYRDGHERGMFTLNAAGEELHAVVWPGICAFPDFTDAKARAWFGSLYAKFLDQGVTGFWNDMNEPATFPPEDPSQPILVHDAGKTFPLDARHDGDGQPGTHARYHNVYGMQMARATFEGLRKLRPDQRPLVLTRAGYAGVQRYSAVWTGDNKGSWEHLALTIPMLTSLSVSGVPFVGADVGGFIGSPPAELYTRWLQAAALTPFFRTHAEIGSKDREPWSYGEEFERINQSAIELRYQLLPYIYTLFAQNETSGSPVLRPLWFDHPRDVKALLLEDQFLLGRDLLVAPVLREGATQRKVYFPQGDAWIDWWDGTRHEGGTFADVPAPIDRLPLFLRAGAAIPTQPTIQHTGEMKSVPLTITVALGAEGTGSIYQDSGDGYAYRKGDSRTTQIELHADTLKLKIAATDRFQRIGFVEFLGLDKAPSSVTADGKVLRDVVFDAKSRRLRVALPDERVHELSLKYSRIIPAWITGIQKPGKAI